MLAVAAGVSFALLANGSAVFLIAGWGLAVLLFVSCLRRSRIAAAIAAFLTTFGPWGFAYVFGIFYVAYAFWLVRRATRRAPSEGTTAARPGA